jgi:hypothetical protein
MNNLVDSPAARSWEPPTSKLTKLIAAPAVEFCKETDVLLVFKARVRSELFRETIEEWADAYIHAPHTQKAPVIEAVRSLLEKSGCRFIKQDLAVLTDTGYGFVQERNKTIIRNKIVASLRSEQRRRRKAASPNHYDAKLSTGKRKRRDDSSPNDDDAKLLKGKRNRKSKKGSSLNDDNAKICEGKAAASMPPSPPEPKLALVPGPPQSLTSSDTLAWIQYYIEKDPAPASSKDTLDDDGDEICKNKDAALTPQSPEPTVNHVPGPPQGLTSSDTLAWIQQYIEKDFAPALPKDTVHNDDANNCNAKSLALTPQSPQVSPVALVPGAPQLLTPRDTQAWIQQYLEKDPAPAPSKDTLNDDDDEICIGKAAVPMPPSPPEPTLALVPGPPQSLTSSDTLAWIEQYFEKDPSPAPPKNAVHVSPETLPQENLDSEPWLFAAAATTPAAKMMPTLTLTQFPLQGGTTAPQQLFQDPPQDLKSKRIVTAVAMVTPMATPITTPTMAYNNDNGGYEYSQGTMNTTTGPTSLRFSTTQDAVVAAPEQAKAMTDTRHQEQEPQLHQQPQQHQEDYGAGTAAAHANGRTGTDPALQVYLDRMQYLEERVLFLRESNDSLVGRILTIEKQTYW